MILTKGKIEEINLQAYIETKILAGQSESLLIVVPTNRKARDLKKIIIDNFKLKPISKIYIETLTTLSTIILREKRTFIPLSEAAASVLIKETVDQLDLSYFNLYTSGIPFGTLDKIKNVISEYKRHGISAKTILKESSVLTGGEREKASDLAKIYELYSNKCENLNAFELGDIYSEILKFEIKEIHDCFFYMYPEVERIVFDGFDEFTNLEIEIIDLLSEVINGELIINLDYISKNNNLFSHLTDTYSDLLNKDFRKILDKTPLDLSKFKETISNNLFKDDIKYQNNLFLEQIIRFSADSRLEEVEKIAHLIKIKLAKDKIEPHKICVVFNLVQNYSSLVRDIFNKYGIPINLTDRIPLKSAQPIIAVISLLELAENDFYFHDLLKVLTNKFLHFDDIDLNNIIYVANKLKITKGVDNWELSIRDAIKIIGFENDLSENEKEELVNGYEKALKDIKSIYRLILPIKQKNTKNEFLKNIRKLLLRLKLPWAVMESSFGKEEEFIKSFTVFLQTLNEVLQLVDPSEENKKYPLHFFTDHIRTISNWARFNRKEKSDYGVLVTSIDEIRGLKFDYLFLGGLCDGDFPTKYSPEIFYSESFKKKEITHQIEERYHFYQTLCCWRKKLYLAIPKSDSESKLVESTFINDFGKVIEMTEIEIDLNSKILTQEHLQIAYAEEMDNQNITEGLKKIDLKPELIKNKIISSKKRIEDPFAENEYSGFLNAENETIQNFLEIYSGKQFSISQLETFAKCPFKYFSERILRLTPIEEPSEEIEPIELGNILHSILYEFYSKVVNEKLKIDTEGSEEFNALMEILFGIANDKISKLNLNSPLAFFEKEKILGIEGKKENSILFKFLRNETDKEDLYKPVLLEHEFGYFSNGSKKVDERIFSIGDLKLRGKIDRIDIDMENKLFNVIDYKLKGRKPSKKDLLDGISLQLPVYLMAGEHSLQELFEGNYNGYNMIIYSLDYNKDNFGPLSVNFSRKKNVTREEIIKINSTQLQITMSKILEYYSKMKTGKFNLSDLEDREEKVCKYCDFKSLCRVKEVLGD